MLSSNEVRRWKKLSVWLVPADGKNGERRKQTLHTDTPVITGNAAMAQGCCRNQKLLMGKIYKIAEKIFLGNNFIFQEF